MKPTSRECAPRWQPSHAVIRSMMTQATKQLNATRPVTRYALRLRGIRVHAHMGVGDSERAQLQKLVVAVDVELGGQLYPATDELDLAADYAQIVRAVDESA